MKCETVGEESIGAMEIIVIVYRNTRNRTTLRLCDDALGNMPKIFSILTQRHRIICVHRYSINKSKDIEGDKVPFN